MLKHSVSDASLDAVLLQAVRSPLVVEDDGVASDSPASQDLLVRLVRADKVQTCSILVLHSVEVPKVQDHRRNSVLQIRKELRVKNTSREIVRETPVRRETAECHSALFARRVKIVHVLDLCTGEAILLKLLDVKKFSAL